MIYLVEDDAGIQKLVTYALKKQGNEAKAFTFPSDFFKALNEEMPDLLILDIMLPEMDGLEILRRIRSDPKTSELPVIMLSAKSSEFDKVLGLDSGADDYIAKPFSMIELLSRIKALLRRVKKTQPEHVLAYKDLIVHVQKHLVEANKEIIPLTKKEFDLLCLLLENEGHVLSRETLLKEIWGYDFDDESRTLDVHVRTLRSKLNACGNYIETIRGVGYIIGGEEE